MEKKQEQQLYCWGDTGLNEQSGAQKASTSPVQQWSSWSCPEHVTKISCGEKHTLIVTRNGEVFSCGSNSRGQLGREHVSDPRIPGRVEGLGGVLTVACGQDHSLAVSYSGDLLYWGAGCDGQPGACPHSSFNIVKPRRVPLPIPDPIPVVQVACGNIHSLALIKTGDVFSWGSNSHGQLGLGKDVSLQPSPAQVLSLSGIAVSRISAGGSHSLFLTLPGLVYCCGANKYGQLGLNRVDEKGRYNVCAVPALRTLEVSLMSCGMAHSAVLTKNGRVFTFGDGSQGQLGHNATANELIPRQVQGIDGPALQIHCGSYHTLVLVSSGQLWSFGSGEEGQLGTGSLEGSLTPNLVQLPWTTDDPTITANDMKIVSGWKTNFAYASSTGNLEREQPIGRLDEKKLQKWLAMDQISLMALREIRMMFSSSSGIVATFTKYGGPPSATDALTVDVDTAAQTFDQMLRVPWIKQTIDSFRFGPLMEKLEISRTALRSPEVFMVLLTCPVLQEDKSVMKVVLPLAICIADMNEKTLGTLRGWWASLTPPNLMRVILVFRNALSFMLSNGLLETHNPEMNYLLKVLKLLFKANNKHGSPKVPLSTFYVEEISGNVDPLRDLILWRGCTERDVEDTPTIFCRYPFVFTLCCKLAMFNIVASCEKNLHRLAYEWSTLWPGVDWTQWTAPDGRPAPVFQLKLRRPHLVEDTFRQLGAADDSAFQRELTVQFTEDLKLTDVNRRDFFFHVFDELMALDAQMFMYNETQTLAWFPTKPRFEVKSYFLFGVLVGIALFNHNIIHLPFPLVLFKKLLNIKPSLDDMKEFEPIVGESLRCTLEDYTDDVVDNMLMTFTVRWDGSDVELDPKERGKPVTSSNKKEFVDAFVNYAFNTSVEKVFEEFKRGFYKVCDRDVVDLFQPDELQGVMVGQETYDWDVLKQNTVYEGEYHPNHPNIITFWEVFEELTEDQKKGFLLFLTGCDRIPILGMDEIKMKIAVRPKCTELHFPESLTCHSLLLLPIYQRYPAKRTLHNRLMVAINHKRGFWVE